MKTNSVKKNYIYNLLYQILTIIVPLITTPYIARVLGSVKTGIYAYAYSVAYYFVVLATLGIDDYGSRKCAQVRGHSEELDKAFSNLFAIQLITNGISSSLYIVYIIFFCRNNKMLAVLEIAFVISGAFNVNWLFFGLEEMKCTVMRNMIVRIAGTICIFLFVKGQNGLFVYTAIMAGSNFVSQISLWPLLNKRIHFVKPDWTESFKQLRSIIILFIPVIAVSIHRRIDKVMLGLFIGYEQVGYYEYADRIITILMGFIVALGTAMLPRISNMIANGEGKGVNKMLHRSFLFVSFVSVGMVFGIMAVMSTFVPIFFGDGYEAINHIVYCLAPSILFMAWANVLRTQYLIPHSKDFAYAFSCMLGMAINVILNLYAIPQFGARGAALVTTISELVICTVQYLFVRKKLSIGKVLWEVFPFFVIGGTMYFVVMAWKESPLYPPVKLLFQVLTGIVVYAGLSLIYIKRNKAELYKEIRHEIVKIIKAKKGSIKNSVD